MGDYETIEAANGFEALRILPQEKVDLVITDINMPDINGHELVRLIRRSNRFSDVAVLIVSEGAFEVGSQPFQAGEKDPYGHQKLGGIGDQYRVGFMLVKIRELLDDIAVHQAVGPQLALQ